MVAKCENKEWGYGYDASAGEYNDLLESGVLDPAKVGPTLRMAKTPVLCSFYRDRVRPCFVLCWSWSLC